MRLAVLLFLLGTAQAWAQTCIQNDVIDASLPALKAAGIEVDEVTDDAAIHALAAVIGATIDESVIRITFVFGREDGVSLVLMNSALQTCQMFKAPTPAVKAVHKAIVGERA
jgi:hypothetical protein